jgi:hypothetical protein
MFCGFVWAKAKFLPSKFATVLGQDVKTEPTTTTLSKVEFGEAAWGKQLRKVEHRRKSNDGRK